MAELTSHYHLRRMSFRLTSDSTSYWRYLCRRIAAVRDDILPTCSITARQAQQQTLWVFVVWLCRKTKILPLLLPFHTVIENWYIELEQRPHTSARENMVRIRCPCQDSDYVQNLTGTSVFTNTTLITFSRKSDHPLQRYKPNCGKMYYLVTLKNPSKIPESGFRGGWIFFISSSVTTDTSVVKYL